MKLICVFKHPFLIEEKKNEKMKDYEVEVVSSKYPSTFHLLSRVFLTIKGISGLPLRDMTQ